MSDDEHLTRLLDEIDGKLKQKLEEIGEAESEEMRRLEEEAKRHLKAEEEALRHTHGQMLAQRHERTVRRAAQAARERLWECQHACIDAVVAEAQALLEREEGVRAWFEAWFPEARRRLAKDAEPVLLVSPAWQKLIGEVKGVTVRARPMLGGAILRDESRGIEVDGSWERRLERLKPALWQKWHESIGKHHQD